MQKKSEPGETRCDLEPRDLESYIVTIVGIKT